MAKRRTSSQDRVLSIEIARVTERAAIAAARHRGRGDEMAADQAAVDAMRRQLGDLAVKGVVVVGEGEQDDAPLLYIGEKVGTGSGPKVDVAIAPLEGSTICAKDLPESMSVIAMADTGSLLHAPAVYMEKLAIGLGYPPDLADLARPIGETLAEMAKVRGCQIADLTACVLDRPRNAETVDNIRAAGAAIRLIGDGDVAGVIHATDAAETGIDLYAGIGGAPEGVLAAAALRCTGGQMQGRLIFRNADERALAERVGITDLERTYSIDEMAAGDVVFAATGVTDGRLLAGVRFRRQTIRTETVVMRSATGTIRRIVADHATGADKFLGDERTADG